MLTPGLKKMFAERYMKVARGFKRMLDKHTKSWPYFFWVPDERPFYETGISLGDLFVGRSRR